MRQGYSESLLGGSDWRHTWYMWYHVTGGSYHAQKAR